MDPPPDATVLPFSVRELLVLRWQLRDLLVRRSRSTTLTHTRPGQAAERVKRQRTLFKTLGQTQARFLRHMANTWGGGQGMPFSTRVSAVPADLRVLLQWDTCNPQILQLHLWQSRLGVKKASGRFNSNIIKYLKGQVALGSVGHAPVSRCL